MYKKIIILTNFNKLFIFDEKKLILMDIISLNKN